jgi:transcriptional regulator with XRE-family HTH domain
MPERPERFGERLSRLRRAKGWNQKELAMRVGIKASQVSKYERGTYEPRLSVLSRFAEVLATSADFLLTGREPSPAGPDRLSALWPVLSMLPLALRSELADFLETVVRAQYLLGVGGAREPHPSIQDAITPHRQI